ncbi:MAG: alcohol dehydrogenase catalytic domain-containing protein [Firmicutes bacterium]|nr:alcohol dehydrogenase catalytic domain-containing protein [Bacillota bacterium]
MRAMVLEEYGKPLVLWDKPYPKPGWGEVTIKVEACGMCGTDIKIAAGKLPGTRVPVTMGHEPAGVVCEVGPGVTRLKEGDKVIAHFYVTCGKCEYCRSNRESICRDLIGRVGFEVDGGYAEYLRLPETSFLKFPDNLNFEEASLLGDAIGTSYHALKTRGRMEPGDYVLIMGVGGVGLHTVQVAKALGGRVVGVDIDEEKLEVARQHGCDYTILYDRDTYVDKAREIAASSYGYAVIVETVGTPDTMERNIKLLRPGGRLCIVGYLPGSTFPVDPLMSLLDEIEILGSRACSKNDLEAVMKLIEMGKIAPLVTRRFALEEVNEAMRILKEEKIIGRAVVIP